MRVTILIIVLGLIVYMAGCRSCSSLCEKPILLDRIELPTGNLGSCIESLNNFLLLNHTGLQINVDLSPPVFCDPSSLTDTSTSEPLSHDLRRQMIDSYTNVVSAKFFARTGNSLSGTHVRLDDVLVIISHTFKCSFAQTGDLLHCRAFPKQIAIKTYAIPAECEVFLFSAAITFAYMECDPLWDKDACFFMWDRTETIAVISSPDVHVKAKKRIEDFFNGLDETSNMVQ